MIRKILAVLAAVALSVTLAATPAQAAKSDCTGYSNVVCLFAFNNFGNPIWRLHPDQIGNCESLVPWGWNDVTTHAMNNAPGTVLVLWQHSNCTGWSYTLGYGLNVSWYGYPGDNQVSAVDVVQL